MKFIPLVDTIGLTPAPGDHESNLKKVGTIPCGCNTNGTLKCVCVRENDEDL